jgi:hypothetical protein
MLANIKTLNVSKIIAKYINYSTQWNGHIYIRKKLSQKIDTVKVILIIFFHAV